MEFKNQPLWTLTKLAVGGCYSNTVQDFLQARMHRLPTKKIAFSFGRILYPINFVKKIRIMGAHHDDHDHGHGHVEDHGTYFDSSTVALGTIYTLFVIGALASILIWG